MSEFKHSEGKWTVTASNEFSDQVSIVTENGAPTFGENEYNAKLIAHAPQMLEMLKEITAEYEFEKGEAYSPTIAKALELIQQATTIK